MENLDPKFIEQQKKRLLEEQKDLQARLARFTTKDPKIKSNYKAKFPKYSAEDETDAEDFEESAHEVTDYTNNVGVENDLEVRLQQVTKALARIEEGHYGHCKNCKNQQSRERLEAEPAADPCEDCNH